MIEEKIKYFVKKSLRSRQNGFALLYAILLTGAVLSVGVILMNIITKQLIFSSINRSSEVSYYYAANSGRECLADAIMGDLFVDYDESHNASAKSSLTLYCFGQNIEFTNGGDGVFTPGEDILFADRKVDLVVYLNIPCFEGLSGCNPSSLNVRERNAYVAIATGYSDAEGGDRSTKRSAPFVQK
jgi:hypothetical protein